MGGLFSEGTQGLSLLPTGSPTSPELFLDGMQLGEVERTWRRHVHSPESSRSELAQTTSALPGGITDLLFMRSGAVILAIKVTHSRGDL